MSHPQVIWIFNASLILIALCPFVDMIYTFRLNAVFLYSMIRQCYIEKFELNR